MDHNDRDSSSEADRDKAGEKSAHISESASESSVSSPKPKKAPTARPRKGGIGDATQRPAQTVIYPPLSDEWIRFPISYLNQNFPARRLVRGIDSGRNMMAYFGNENILRTRYPLRLGGGRTGRDFGNEASSNYPDSGTVVPIGTSLEEMVTNYPLHVWGEGLRLFMAESWTPEQIHRGLPACTKRSKAKTRPWNYIQKGFERQTMRMHKEQAVEEEEEEEKNEVSSSPLLPSPSPPSSPSPPEPLSPEQPQQHVIAPPVIGAYDPQRFPENQPRPSIPELRAMIQREHEMLFVAFLARERLVRPGFTAQPVEEQHRSIGYRLELHFANWERQLLQTLPVPSRARVTDQRTGSGRELQILLAIIKERPRYATDPDSQRQRANEIWLAHMDLLSQVRTWRENADMREALAQLHVQGDI